VHWREKFMLTLQELHSERNFEVDIGDLYYGEILLLLLLLLLFTAIGFPSGDSSPTLVQTKMIKQHYTVVQHNTIKRKHKIICT
jgi:hypothetical protein